MTNNSNEEIKEFIILIKIIKKIKIMTKAIIGLIPSKINTDKPAF